MAAPEPKVYFAPGYTWTTEDASVVWVEISSYVLLGSGISTDRGRSSETDDDQSGTLRLRLKNNDRRFDPSHAAGPYFGDLKPGVPIKVEADADGGTYPIFRGFIDAWPQDYDPGNTFAWVSVSCTDGLAKLALAGMPTSVLALEIEADSPDVWYRLNETTGTQMGDASGGNQNGAYLSPVETTQHPNQWETVGAVAFSGDQVGTYAPTFSLPFPFTMEACFVVPDGTLTQVLTFGDGSTIWAAITAGSSLAFSLVNDAGSEYATGSSAPNPGDPIHILGVWEDVATTAFYINGELITTVVVGPTPFAVSFAGVGVNAGFDPDAFDGEPISDVAIYRSVLDATRAAAHGEAFTAPWDGDTTGERIERLLDVAGWPSDLRNVATGLSILGPAVLGDFALALLKRAEGAEQGRLFISRDGKLTFLDRYYHVTETAGTTSQATFSDDGADEGYSGIAFDYDTTLIKNRVKASRRGGTASEVTDATSITDYGDRSDGSLTDLDFSNDHQARTAAEFRLDVYRQPTLRVRPITVPLHGMTEAQQATLLGLELGQRVTVERTPQGVGSAIVQECSIEGISHNVADLAWTTTFRLAPIPDHMDEVALWGTGEWDTAVWAY